MRTFQLTAPFQPQGDQPQAIQELTSNLQNGARDQVLLGVTGSGKTFTMAHVIQNMGRPALILAHNKTLAAQLYGEMKALFPHNAVEYFVSYYDYYQPEAFVPKTNTYIEKEATINDQIDRMRHSATRALLERRDVIVVASVSCIYGIGSVESYAEMVQKITKGACYPRADLLRTLTKLHYKRNDMQLSRGTFRMRGDVLEIFPAHYEDRAWRISFFDDLCEDAWEFDPLTGHKGEKLETITIYPNSHHVIPGPTLYQAIKQIKLDLGMRLEELEKAEKLLEAQRLKERTTYDLEMLAATGSCAGVENYSRYFTGRAPGEPPPTLFEYVPKDALLFVDESHVSVPQLRAMYRGDAVRKKTLSEFGFRLPSCADNRPLKFEEWENMRPQTLFVSATPGPWELEQTHGAFSEQVIRPTGLLDPVCTIHPTEHQIDHLLEACRHTIAKGGRILVTTLTKKMAENLQEYFVDQGLKSRYIHADVDTLERIEIIQGLRRGTFDILVGINLLREGLDIPECSLVAILDADKEGYLRSYTALIQTIGRAARNLEGRVILYADRITGSMQQALDETKRRRDKQHTFNMAHNITPQGIKKEVGGALDRVLDRKADTQDNAAPAFKTEAQRQKHIATLEKEMFEAADAMAFEKAAALRDQIKTLQRQALL